MSIEDPDIETLGFSDVPTDVDVILMDEKYLLRYEEAFKQFLSGAEYEHVGPGGFASVTKIHDEALEILLFTSWADRVHSIRVFLPRDQFVTCIASWKWDERPHLFVDSAWLLNVYTKNHSVFGLFDAIGIKTMIQNARLKKKHLIELREGVDLVAANFLDVSFISFADSILLKSNWTAGHFETGVKCTYRPEVFIRIFFELRNLYRRVIGLDSYIVLAQGANEYSEDGLLHVSESKNHISLNSLGIPFAELKSIESSARKRIRNREHIGAEIYMDQSFFFSLSSGFKVRKDPEEKYQYEPIFANGDGAVYYCFQSADYLDSQKGKVSK